MSIQVKVPSLHTLKNSVQDWRVYDWETMVILPDCTPLNVDTSILYYNAKSLIHTIDKLSALYVYYSIVLLWKHGLGSEVTVPELSIPNYQIICYYRNRHGGGTLMYLHNYLPYKVILNGPTMLEFSVLSVSNYFCNLCVGLFYHPPGSPVSVLDNLHTD